VASSDHRHKDRKPFQVQLDAQTGVPVYRQIIDQVTAAMATGALQSGDQLPTVRQLAVDLSVNPNTVIRAYRELEIRGVLETQQGSGTYVSDRPLGVDDSQRERQLNHIVGELVGRAGAAGFTIEQIIGRLHALKDMADKEV
jgi:GntR family transcriptional regulator